METYSIEGIFGQPFPPKKITVNGIIYLPESTQFDGVTPCHPPEPEPEPTKSCSELLAEIEAEAPKGKTLRDRAVRIKYLERCQEFRKTDVNNHVCDPENDLCYWGDRDLMGDHFRYDEVEHTGYYFDDYGFIPRSKPLDILETAMETLEWGKGYLSGVEDLHDYLHNLLEAYVVMDDLVPLIPGVIPVSDGDEFLGWLIEE